MQIQDQTYVTCSGLRLVAIGLMLVLGLEWSQPLFLLAQPNDSQAAVSSADESPPIQEAETVDERKPFYKKWWFWAIVGAVVAGAAIGIAAGSSGGSSPPPSGSVTVTGPPPR